MPANEHSFDTFKAQQRQMWASFTPTQMFTTPVAGQLVKFAQIADGERVLDVATGTGVVAITAARAGARVHGLDLTPALLDHARENARIAGVEVEWQEADAERLPYPDSSFDVVVSQFGHMFAPRPDVVVAEMRRVLKPTGRIAFATFPPEHYVGRMFALMTPHAPPPPAGVAPPPAWGNPAVVAERLAAGFHPPFFSRGVMLVPALSLAHFRGFLERSIGPLEQLIRMLEADEARLTAFRQEFDDLTAAYYVDNTVHQDYLMTRARAR
jgi:SAM-dependent methyltransferase